MAYKINYKESVFKDLKRIDKTQAKKILDKIDTELANKPGINKQLTKNLSGLYSYRVNNYRVIYQLSHDNKTILILRISHRKDVYKE